MKTAPQLSVVHGDAGEPVSMDEALDSLVRRVKLAKPVTVMVVWDTGDRRVAQPQFASVPSGQSVEEGLLELLVDRIHPATVEAD